MTPRSSAPTTNILHPTRKRPSRTARVSFASSRARTLYHPSEISISDIVGTLPIPEAVVIDRIALTTYTAGAPGFSSFSKILLTCGRSARLISRSYLYNMRCSTADSLKTPKAYFSGNARATHACVHTIHLYAFATHSFVRDASLAPALIINSRISRQPTRPRSTLGKRNDFAVSALSVATHVSTNAGRT